MKGTIDSIAFGGEGILRDNGLVVFIPFTAPGDQVTAEIVTKKKNFATGKLIHIDAPSPLRTPPRCPYFGTCGGCQFQHLNYEAQLAAKHKFIADSLKKIGKIDPPPFSVMPAHLQWHYRRHIRLKLQKDAQGFAAGYTSYDGRSFVPIAECPIFHPDHDLSLKPLLSSLSNEGIEEGTLRIIKQGEGLLLAFDFFPILPLNHTICASFPFDGIVMRSSRKQKHWGSIKCKTEVLGITARFSPYGFVQNHPEQSVHLYQSILEFLPTQAEKILDLYCGIGVTSLLFARAGKQVIGVESHPETIALAKENGEANKLSAQFFEGKCEVLGIELLEKEKPDTVLCNPPRTGLDPRVLKALIAEKPACILYVSCMPATLARDLHPLIQAGYTLDKIQAFDMFPQTTHVETLVSLILR